MAVTEKRGPFVRRKALAEALDVEPALLEDVSRAFPVLWPSYYLDLTKDRATHPIAKMGRPSSDELVENPGDLPDPVADLAQRPIPFVVRKHADRVIILTTKKCHFYCRFCFRREESFQKTQEPGRQDWERIFAFLRDNPEIEEPILSGGDPLTLKDEELVWIKTQLSSIESVKRWRIHSRAPVHFPQRVTRDLLEKLATVMAPRLITHFNHVDEVTTESQRIADDCSRLGIPLFNQSVLLAGINDSVDAQVVLWTRLEALGIKPYYIHHPDRARGNAAFRVSIRRGRLIFAQLLSSLGSSAPRYVLDLPDGRGKVPVMRLVESKSGHWTYTHEDGTCSFYQDWTSQ